jgi:conjugative transfer signal peptidase TraF
MSKSIIKRQKQKLKRKRSILIYISIPLLFLLFLWVMHYFVVMNITDSMPIGLYQKDFNQIIKRGSYVGICLNEAESKLAIKSGILIENHQCNSGSDLLIKEVIALPSDQVQVTNKHMIVTENNKTTIYDAPRFLYSPKNQKPVLTFVDLGNYQSKGYWVYGSNNQKYSWDSRYFGELTKQNIRYVLTPIWTLSSQSA